MNSIPVLDFPGEEDVVITATQIILLKHRVGQGNVDFPDLPHPRLRSLCLTRIGPETHELFAHPTTKILVEYTYRAILQIVQRSHPELTSCSVTFEQPHTIRRVLTRIMTALKFQPVSELETNEEKRLQLRAKIHKMIQDRYRFLEAFISSRDNDEQGFILLKQIEKCLENLYHLRNEMSLLGNDAGADHASKVIPSFQDAVAWDLTRETYLESFDPSDSEEILLKYFPPNFRQQEAALFVFSFCPQEEIESYDLPEEQVLRDDLREMWRKMLERKMLIVAYIHRFLLLAGILNICVHPSLSINTSEIEKSERHLRILLTEIEKLQGELREVTEVDYDQQTYVGLSVSDNDLIDLSTQCQNILHRTQQQESLDPSILELLILLSETLSHFSEEALRTAEDNRVLFEEKCFLMQTLRDATYGDLLVVEELLTEISHDYFVLDDIGDILKQAFDLLQH